MSEPPATRESRSTKLRPLIRDERAGDAAAIRALVTRAFDGAPHASGAEPRIVDALREAGALKVSLVAEAGGTIVGHVAISPVTLGAAEGWYGLGPVAVEPDRQRGGIGAALIAAALDRLREGGAAGCVVLGDPAYYRRFGFAPDPAVTFPAAPPEYFQVLAFHGPPPAGEVQYSSAFGG